jgi:hypothetical protein
MEYTKTEMVFNNSIDEFEEQANTSLDRIEAHVERILKENRELKLLLGGVSMELEMMRSKYKLLEAEWEFLQKMQDEEERI